MRHFLRPAIGAIFLSWTLAPAQTTIEATLDGEALIQRGGANAAAMACVTCHAPDGKGTAAAGFPRLAGLSFDYIVKQLADFRAGRRKSPLMEPVAAALTPEESAAIASAYARRPRVNVLATPPVTPEEGSGAWIALRGAWERNIPECTLCHGPAGLGVDPSFPPLAGQSAIYLETQLLAWRSSPAGSRPTKTGARTTTPPTRMNDPNGLMRHIAASLTPSEIKSVAEYFAGLPDTDLPLDPLQQRLR